jgi:molybdopterin converting factor small subunit
MLVEFHGIARERAGVSELELDAPTLGDALEFLSRRFPNLRELIADRRLHPALAANLNTDRFVSDPATPLNAHDLLLILSADAGG